MNDYGFVEGFSRLGDAIRRILFGYTDEEAAKIKDEWSKVTDPKPENGEGLIIGGNIPGLPAGDYSGMSSIVILVLILLFIFKK